MHEPPLLLQIRGPVQRLCFDVHKHRTQLAITMLAAAKAVNPGLHSRTKISHAAIGVLSCHLRFQYKVESARCFVTRECARCATKKEHLT